MKKRLMILSATVLLLVATVTVAAAMPQPSSLDYEVTYNWITPATGTPVSRDSTVYLEVHYNFRAEPGTITVGLVGSGLTDCLDMSFGLPYVADVQTFEATEMDGTHVFSIQPDKLKQGIFGVTVEMRLFESYGQVAASRGGNGPSDTWCVPVGESQSALPVEPAESPIDPMDPHEPIPEQYPITYNWITPTVGTEISAETPVQLELDYTFTDVPGEFSVALIGFDSADCSGDIMAAPYASDIQTFTATALTGTQYAMLHPDLPPGTRSISLEMTLTELDNPNISRGGNGPNDTWCLTITP